MTEEITNKPQTAIKSVTHRAAVILSLLLLLTTTSAAGAVYTGSKSGELKTKIIDPLNRALSNVTQSISESLKEQSKTPSDQSSQPSTSSEVNIESNVKIEVNEGTGVTSEGDQSGEGYQINWVYPSLPSGGGYEDTQKAYDEWWAKVQEQNRQLSEQSKQDLEKFQEESRQRLEEFKLQGQEGMEEFRQEMERKQQEFLREHGIDGP